MDSPYIYTDDNKNQEEIPSPIPKKSGNNSPNLSLIQREISLIKDDQANQHTPINNNQSKKPIMILSQGPQSQDFNGKTPTNGPKFEYGLPPSREQSGTFGQYGNTIDNTAKSFESARQRLHTPNTYNPEKYVRRVVSRPQNPEKPSFDKLPSGPLNKSGLKTGRSTNRKTTGRKTYRKMKTQPLDEASFTGSELQVLQELMKNVNNPEARKAKTQYMQENPYYHMMRVKLARRASPEVHTPPEFDEQVEQIQVNSFVPKQERNRDLEIEEKTELERVRDHKDSYPMLEFRRKLWRLKAYFSAICFKIISNQIFDTFILLIIIWNSVMLASAEEGSYPAVIDDIFLGIYTAEMALKIFGMGFYFGKNTYLKDNWNVMDFVIVVTAYLPKVVDSQSVNLQSLRSLRIARPLRTISNIESLRVIVVTLLAALAPLVNTLFILFFLFMIFAIGGLQLFQGLLKRRCFSIETGIVMPDKSEKLNGGEMYCTSTSDCPTDYICGRMSTNPNFGINNFDHIGSAFLMVFQTSTLEGYSPIMISLQKVFNPFVAIYFIFLIFVGAFFLLNLTLAVIKGEFTNSTDSGVQTRKKKDKRLWSHDDKLVEKIKNHKLSIIDRMNQRKEEQIIYDKFEIKREGLRAIEKKSRFSLLGSSSFYTKNNKKRRKTGIFHKLNKIVPINGGGGGGAQTINTQPKILSVIEAAKKMKREEEKKLQRRKSKNTLNEIPEGVVPINELESKKNSDKKKKAAQLKKSVTSQLARRQSQLENISKMRQGSMRDPFLGFDIQNPDKSFEKKNEKHSRSFVGSSQELGDELISPSTKKRIRSREPLTPRADAFKLKAVSSSPHYKRDTKRKGSLPPHHVKDSFTGLVEETTKEDQTKESDYGGRKGSVTSLSMKQKSMSGQLSPKSPFGRGTMNSQEIMNTPPRHLNNPSKPRVAEGGSSANNIVSRSMTGNNYSGYQQEMHGVDILQQQTPERLFQSPHSQMVTPIFEQEPLKQAKKNYLRPLLEDKVRLSHDLPGNGGKQFDIITIAGIRSSIEKSQDIQEMPKERSPKKRNTIRKESTPGIQPQEIMKNAQFAKITSDESLAELINLNQQEAQVVELDVIQQEGQEWEEKQKEKDQDQINTIQQTEGNQAQTATQQTEIQRTEQIDSQQNLIEHGLKTDAYISSSPPKNRLSRPDMTVHTKHTRMPSKGSPSPQKKRDPGMAALYGTIRKFVTGGGSTMGRKGSSHSNDGLELRNLSPDRKRKSKKHSSKAAVSRNQLMAHNNIAESSLLMKDQEIQEMLNDSDFFEEQQPRINLKNANQGTLEGEILDEEQEQQQRRKSGGNMRAIRKRMSKAHTKVKGIGGATNKSLKGISDNEIEEQDDQVQRLFRQQSLWAATKNYLGSQEGLDEEEEENPFDEYDIDMDDDDDEDDEQYIIDLRYLKTVPNFGRGYEGYSTDDVLPSRIEQELERQERADRERLEKTRLPLVYPISKRDQQKAEHRRLMSVMTSLGGTASQSMVFGRSKAAESLRDKIASQVQLEKEIEMYTNDPGKLMSGHLAHQHSLSQPRNRIMARRRMLARQAADGDVEQDLNEIEMKDYITVLDRINQPFDNENSDSDEEELEKFHEKQDWRKIRQDDLDEGAINKSNWSGTQVLQGTSIDFAIDRVKMALNNLDGDIWRRGIMGVVHALRRKTKTFVELSLFNNFIMLSVFLNTLILSTEGLITDDETENLLSDFNFTFTIIFTVEAALKIFGYGVQGYVSDKMNLFDFAIVVISWVEEIYFSGSNNSFSAFRAVRLFRTFRVLRVTKLLRSLKFMRVIVGVVSRSIKKFMYIFIILFLLMFIYSLLGMNLFKGRFNFEDNTSRQNFDSFGNSFMAVFQIMTQENWNDILTPCLRSDQSSVLSLIYLISWIFIGNYIFLNLFLAILLEEFTGDETKDEFDELYDEDDADEEEAALNNSAPFKSGELRVSQTLNLGSRGESSKKQSKSVVSSLVNLGDKADSSGNLHRSREFNKLGTSLVSLDELNEDQDHIGKNKRLFQDVYCNKSFYFFSKQNWLRIKSYKIVHHRYFESVILAMIVLNSVKLALDTYIPDDNDTVWAWSEGIDYFFNVFFLLEAVLKALASGFILDRNAYLRDNWNVMDFFIVVASMLDMSLRGVKLDFIRILRLLRTLRPLRFISHNVSMKIVVTALLESFGAIFNVVIVLVIIWLMFAILAVNIVGQKLGRCETIDESYYGIGQQECVGLGYDWENPRVNFDNVFSGMLSLFIISTQEGWPDIMYTIADADDADKGPSKNNSAAFAYIYFVVFIFIGSYFLLNLFVGVIFFEYIRAEKNENTAIASLSSQHQRWLSMQKLALQKKPDVSKVKPQRKWQIPFFNLISSTKFDVFIVACILLNIISMALTYDGESEEYALALKIVNYCFSAVFLAEMILKHLGLGIKRYWISGWNRFDAFVVFASIVDIIMDIVSQSLTNAIRVGPQLARVFRVLRVSRLLKLIKKFQGLQKILNTLAFSLPSLLNVGALLTLVYFIYSILATFIFKEIVLGKIIGSFVNFDNFSNAIVTLFRASTGEDWYVIMFDTMYPLECTDGTTDCGVPVAATFFWLTYMIICQFIMLNFFILIILQQFEEFYMNTDNPIDEFRRKFEDHFRPTWEKISLPYGGHRIPESMLLEFFQTLRPPLGFNDKKFTRREVALAITQMNFKSDDEGYLYFNDILHAAFKRTYGGERSLEDIVPKAVLLEEAKARKKLEQLKKKHGKLFKNYTSFSNEEAKNLQDQKHSVNPLFKMLFIGMLLKSWFRYAQRITAKMRAAEELGHEYHSSDSSITEYTESEEEEDEDDEDDEYESSSMAFSNSVEPLTKKEKRKKKRNTKFEYYDDDDSLHKSSIISDYGTDQMNASIIEEEDEYDDFDPQEMMKSINKMASSRGNVDYEPVNFDELRSSKQAAALQNAVDQDMEEVMKQEPGQSQQNSEGNSKKYFVQDPSKRVKNPSSKANLDQGQEQERQLRPRKEGQNPTLVLTQTFDDDERQIQEKIMTLSRQGLGLFDAVRGGESQPSGSENAKRGSRISNESGNQGVYNYNINNNFIINNNYYINQSGGSPVHGRTGSLESVTRQTNVILERSVNRSRGDDNNDNVNFNERYEMNINQGSDKDNNDGSRQNILQLEKNESEEKEDVDKNK